VLPLSAKATHGRNVYASLFIAQIAVLGGEKRRNIAHRMFVLREIPQCPSRLGALSMGMGNWYGRCKYALRKKAGGKDYGSR
jgi:hypothetical protein